MQSEGLENQLNQQQRTTSYAYYEHQKKKKRYDRIIPINRCATFSLQSSDFPYEIMRIKISQFSDGCREVCAESVRMRIVCVFSCNSRQCEINTLNVFPCTSI